MTLATHEFIRRFLMHVLPKGFHRIRHYGLFANGNSRRQHRPRPRAARRAASHDASAEAEHAAEPDQPRVLPTPARAAAAA